MRITPPEQRPPFPYRANRTNDRLRICWYFHVLPGLVLAPAEKNLEPQSILLHGYILHTETHQGRWGNLDWAGESEENDGFIARDDFCGQELRVCCLVEVPDAFTQRVTRYLCFVGRLH